MSKRPILTVVHAQAPMLRNVIQLSERRPGKPVPAPLSAVSSGASTWCDLLLRLAPASRRKPGEVEE